MRIESFIDTKKLPGISGLHAVIDSFGTVDGEAEYTRTERDGKVVYEHVTEEVRLTAKFTVYDNGAVIRRDTLENISDKPVTLRKLMMRFHMDGNEYDVYTQFSGWQHESSGGWQRLITEIAAGSTGIRACDSAAPIMALSNRYTGKNTVFHLISNGQWRMAARKLFYKDREMVSVEMGLTDVALSLVVSPAEVIELPTVIFFNAESKIDLDSYKLHEVYNELYPRKCIPVVYNSWLYCFDKLDIDDLKRQAICAKDLGIEAFMVDAGWFGDGADWWSSVGDWEENLTSGPCGRLGELSEHVRSLGMTFGLWFEPERANPKSCSATEHPDYYIDGTFLDYANPEAVDFMLEKISKQIERYHIGWVKFDFNASTPIDKTGCAFYRYTEGRVRFIKRLREKFPDLYITGCAGGGYRMELGEGRLFDSFWFSDNQGPCEGIRIIKDTLKRMPTSLIERWNVQKYCDGFNVYEKGVIGKMIHSNDATWDTVVGVDDSFSEEFLKGGPMGFSCDIDAFPEKYKARWREVIAEYKAERGFYMTASARILTDSDDLIAIEYSDKEFNMCVIQIFARTVRAADITLYPTLSPDADYSYNGETVTAKEISEDGIRIDLLKANSCHVIRLDKV